MPNCHSFCLDLVMDLCIHLLYRLGSFLTHTVNVQGSGEMALNSQHSQVAASLLLATEVAVLVRLSACNSRKYKYSQAHSHSCVWKTHRKEQRAARAT